MTPTALMLRKARAFALVDRGIADALAESLRVKRLARMLAPLCRAEVVPFPARSAYEQLPSDTEPEAA